ncbi:hypothetical protein [Microbulbifer halophilus]|uniref:hypothetical protein n=1 Tax=Microbulbifer halophilus TaxID=453963 RepID=UPI002244E0AA|nr:hypothetical protein [Microbulbifer halophilus]MCW8125106.1 hypothetical protein [Microbulbifer halophilus]
MQKALQEKTADQRCTHGGGQWNALCLLADIAFLADQQGLYTVALFFHLPAAVFDLLI